jgi:hypothetical protein
MTSSTGWKSSSEASFLAMDLRGLPPLAGARSLGIAGTGMGVAMRQLDSDAYGS